MYLLNFRYGTVWGPLHGDSTSASPSTDHSIVLNTEAYINKIEGLVDTQCVIKLTLYATNGQVYGPYGGSVANAQSFVSSQPGYKLIYISGSAGLWIDAIYFHYETLSTATKFVIIPQSL